MCPSQVATYETVAKSTGAKHVLPREPVQTVRRRHFYRIFDKMVSEEATDQDKVVLGLRVTCESQGPDLNRR